MLWLGGIDKGGTILPKDKSGRQAVCYTCHVCGTDAVLDIVSKKQIACESDCGKWNGYIAGELGLNCDPFQGIQGCLLAYCPFSLNYS
jgi:hypothetical protein